MTARSAPAAALPVRPVRAKAANPIGAAPGQKVVVQSDTKKMLRIVALVYLTPVVLFLAGYLLTALLGQCGRAVFYRGSRLFRRHCGCGGL